MKTFIINNTYLIAAENEVVARNLAECKCDNVESVKLLGS